MSNDENDVRIRIGLPLPMGVAGSLMEAIGAMYPGAMVDMRGGGIGSFAGGEMTIVIPANADPVDVSAEEFAALASETGGPNLTSFNSEGLGVSDAEEAVRTLFEHTSYLLSTSGADGGPVDNYAELTLYNPDDPTEQYVVSVARSKGQTAHQMHAAAKERIASAIEFATEYQQTYAEVEVGDENLGDLFSNILSALTE